MSQDRQKTAQDRLLGMDRPITRRDFLNGALLTSAGFIAPAFGADADHALQDNPSYYPPSLLGLRGSHPGSFEAAHALRDGHSAPAATDTGEKYDLIIVGAGISGLAAAHFYRAAKPHSRILLLDNHDDFGGHAKRNEFMFANRTQLANGGTLEIDSPRPYSAVSAGLLTTLGIHVEKLAKRTQHLNYYRDLGMQRALFFDRETFGADHLAVGRDQIPYEQLLASAPLTPTARAKICELEAGTIDYLSGLNSAQKKDRLSRVSYADFLRTLAGADDSVIQFYQARTQGWWGVGIDAVSALECWGLSLGAGFKSMQLEPGAIARMGPTAGGYAATGGSYKLHFPDGNASIARALVRNLIPDAIAGNGIESLVTARARYPQLDRAGNPVRLRLNSTAIRARNAQESGTEVTYLRAGKAYTVRGSATVLACYNMIIPYLCPELPAEQKAALHELVKAPLVYTNVALRNWQAFERLRVHEVHAPGGYHTTIEMNPHVNIGSYRSVQSAAEPMLIRMTRVPCSPGAREHDQNRIGRQDILSTSFETFERNIRDQLQRTFSAGGFDAARDITGIMVNRWPHGYAPEYNPLFDPDGPEELRPNVIGRARFGRIAIANSDSGGAAYTDSAIDQAHRAVMELLNA